MQFDFSQIKLIVGLGNIGKAYENTRHNAGFLFVDQLVRTLNTQGNWQENTKLKAFIVEVGTGENKKIFAKPITLMNLSGEAVQAISHYFKIPPDQMLIAHDDMDITLSEYKLHFDKGPKLHNGIDSVERLLGSTAFWRLRIGIEHRPVRGNKGIPGLTYALERFSQDELATVQTTFQTLIEQSFRGRAPRAPEYS